MNHALAIFAPVIGILSETFIRRHMEELLPSRTVVIAETSNKPYGGHWNVDCPSLILQQIRRGGLKREVVRAVTRKLGWHRDQRLAIVKRFLKHHGVRVVLGEYLDWSYPWLSLAQEMGIRFFGHAHGYDISMRLREPNWRITYQGYNEADGVITISQFSRARLIGVGLDPTKIHVVPYGVHVPSQPTRPHRDTVHCVAIGRMVGKKAPILTLDAFRRALEACRGLRLDYVGAGELLPAVRQFVHAFDLSDRVTLYGDQPNAVVQRLMIEADIFLQHSMTDPETGDEEGLPVAILEAMANALPVVSTRHSGIPEAVLDGDTGYLVDEGDVVGMAERIVTLARDPDLRQRMGGAAWQRAREHFSWEKNRAELLTVLGIV